MEVTEGEIMSLEDLTKYEIARIIGARAFQLELGAPPLIKVAGNVDSITLAKEELERGMIPISVIRTEHI